MAITQIFESAWKYFGEPISFGFIFELVSYFLKASSNSSNSSFSKIEINVFIFEFSSLETSFFTIDTTFS